jgi:hypothetical protein
LHAFFCPSIYKKNTISPLVFAISVSRASHDYFSVKKIFHAKQIDKNFIVIQIYQIKKNYEKKKLLNLMTCVASLVGSPVFA